MVCVVGFHSNLDMCFSYFVSFIVAMTRAKRHLVSFFFFFLFFLGGGGGVVYYLLVRF